MITNGDVLEALQHGIDKRWAALARGVDIVAAPICKLCELFNYGSDIKERCFKCPLKLIGDCCLEDPQQDTSGEDGNSSWGTFKKLRTVESAEAMISQLKLCKSKFFNIGMDMLQEWQPYEGHLCKLDEITGKLFNFINKTYTQEQDARQKMLGLQYTTAETHDLAATISKFLIKEKLKEN